MEWDFIWVFNLGAHHKPHQQSSFVTRPEIIVVHEFDN